MFENKVQGRPWHFWLSLFLTIRAQYRPCVSRFTLRFGYLFRAANFMSKMLTAKAKNFLTPSCWQCHSRSLPIRRYHSPWVS